MIDVDPLPRFGSQVALRRLSVADLDTFQAYRSDPELGRYQGWSLMTEREAREFLDEMNAAALFRPGEWMQLGMADPQTLALLGDVGLYLDTDCRQAEIGFTLARPYHGRGLATAAVREAAQLAFQCTVIERILGITDARNRASIAVLERVGMHKAEERSVTFRGEDCVEYVYVLPR